MELHNIEHLLEKYFRAETTLGEEQKLRDFFNSEKVPPHLESYRPLFAYFTGEQENTIQKEIQLPEQKHNRRWLSVAAAVLLLFSVFGWYRKNEAEKREARIAYAEMQKALDMISVNLNKGNLAIARLETYNETKDKIFKEK